MIFSNILCSFACFDQILLRARILHCAYVFRVCLHSESVDSRIGANFLQNIRIFREIVIFIELVLAFLHSECLD